MTTPLSEADKALSAPWWRSHRAWWVAGIVVLLAMLIGIGFGFIVEQGGRPSLTPYGAFLDQLDAGNVAAVTFRGMEIDGRFRHPIAGASPADPTRRDAFSSRVPDFGDPTLIAKLRRHHVVIDVAAASHWISPRVGLPWLILLLLGAAVITALVRLARGGKTRSQPGSNAQPMQAVLTSVSRLFVKPPRVEEPAARKSNEPKAPWP